MKKWMNEKYTTIALYTLGVILASLLFLLLILNFGQILSFLFFLAFSARSIVYGLLVALALFPLCHRLERLLRRYVFKKKERLRALRFLSVTLTFLVLLICLGIVAVSILPMLTENYSELTEAFTGYINAAVSTLQQNEFVYNVFVSLTGLTGGDATEIIQSLLTRYSELFSNLASSLVSILLSLIYSTTDVLVALILAFYFLLSRDMLRAICRKLATAVFPRKLLSRVASFARTGYTNLMDFLSARLLCSFILAILIYGFAWLLGIPFYPLIALIALVLNMIPVLGPIAAAAICSLIVFVLKPGAFWFFVLVIVALNALEHYLIEHYLLNKRLRPNTALALVLILIAYHYAGFAGAIFAIPVFVTLLTEAHVLLNRRLEKKGLATATSEYISPIGAEIHAEVIANEELFTEEAYREESKVAEEDPPASGEEPESV